MDSRIGPKFLQASIGFGGSCFQKDILNLVYLCEQFGLKEVADYWATVVDMNNHQQVTFTKRIIDAMFNTVSGDVRETPAVKVCELLMEDAAICSIWDPK